MQKFPPSEIVRTVFPDTIHPAQSDEMETIPDILFPKILMSLQLEIEMQVLAINISVKVQ